MAGNRIHSFDRTLRDYGQKHGVDLAVVDKLAIAHVLNEFGVDYVEGGWSGASPTNGLFFGTPLALAPDKFVAFCMTPRPGRSADTDMDLAAILSVGKLATCLFGKTWYSHFDLVLEIDPDENLAIIGDSISGADKGLEPMFDCEPAFEGSKANPDFALAYAKAAAEAGARWALPCGTSGWTMPHGVSEIVTAMTDVVPGARLNLHCHKDTENVVATLLALVRAGCRHLRGIINWLSKRGGNANPISLIASLAWKIVLNTGIEADELTALVRVSPLPRQRLVPNSHAAYVSAAALARKGGRHVSAVQKCSRTYVHLQPEAGGSRRYVGVSDQAGKSNILARVRELSIDVDINEHPQSQLVEEIKTLEAHGYAVERPETSFELMASDFFGQVSALSEIQRFRVMDGCRFSARGQAPAETKIAALLRIGGRRRHEVAVGNGLVNSLKTGLFKGKPFYPCRDWLRLLQPRVRISPPNADRDGTDAVTRVIIESSGVTELVWQTLGVSANFISVSIRALADSLTFKTMRGGVTLAAR